MNKKPSVTPGEVLLEARLSGFYGKLKNRAETRASIFRLARREGVQVTPEELQEEADRFRREHNLTGAAETEEWLERNHLNLEQFERFLESTVLRRKLARKLMEEVDADRYAAVRLASDATRTTLTRTVFGSL